MTSPSTASALRFVLSRLNRNRHFEGFDDVALFALMDEDVAVKAADLIAQTRAQLRQDVLAAALSGFKEGGYFVEVGATDGLYLSNTLLLERQFGWSGILAEPARYWHETLRKERTAHIDTRCVHSQSGLQTQFREVEADQALSTMTNFTDGDLHEQTRKIGSDYTVQTISLNDLLAEFSAPQKIDLLSIDTEGSELTILRGFDFDAHQFGLITCEHNYTENRNDILRLLASKGYIRVLNHISLFDDWYIHTDQLPAMDTQFPGWKSVSDQSETTGEPELTGNQRMIRLLKETVENLILDRDAYKSALEHHLSVQTPTETNP